MNNENINTAGQNITEKAVVDRIESDFAVLYIGEEERKVDVPRSQLPQDVKEGQHLKIEMQNEQVVSAEIDEEEMDNTRNRIQTKMERLRRGEHLQ